MSARPRTCGQTLTSTGCSKRRAALTPPLKAASYQALFGLLAVSGMRVGEGRRARAR